MLNTFSKFYFGHFIDQSNKSLPFNDGTDKVATLNVGDYTLDSFAVEVSRALNAASSVAFTVTVNRTTRKITIAGDSNFELHVASGTASNPFSLIGFSGSDRSGSNSYTGNLASGSEFKPQLKLQKFVDFTDDQQASYSNVAKSANGTVEVISFGIDQFMTCEVVYQTNNNVTGSVIENQANGLDNLRTFLQYAVNKRKIQFIPDRDSPSSNVIDCILESTSASSSGTGYRLKEYLSSTPGFFSSGVLKFRKVV